MLTILIVVIVAALLFDYINGFHDTANAIATTVGTGVMSLSAAVLMAAVLNLVGALSGTAVASYIANGIADVTSVTQLVLVCALLGASTWNLITWWYGIPASSSHALVGGLCGAVCAHMHALHYVHWMGVCHKVLIPLVVAPVSGFLIAVILMIIILWVVRHRHPEPVNRSARVLQVISAASLAFSHGLNDAQKAMGIITLAVTNYVLFNGDHLPAWIEAHRSWMLPGGPKHNAVPLWVIISCAMAMALGTAAGGKRIIKTMGTKIIRITPLQGFVAQTSGTLVILFASRFGIPVSTTHNITSAIMGAGATRRINAVRWPIAINILIAWVLTLPMSGLITYLMTSVIERL